MKESEAATVPTSILRNRTLAPLESISEYLKEKKDYNYHQIAVLLNRNDRTIWTCCNRAKKKRQATGEAIPEASGEEIPVEIFADRTLAPLETLTAFLKDTRGMNYHEIAMLLNRDDRTIWTCYNRAQKKRAKKEVPSA